MAGTNIDSLKGGLQQGALSVRIPVPLPFWEAFSIMQGLKEERAKPESGGPILAMGKVMGMMTFIEDVAIRMKVLTLMQQLGYIIFVESEVEKRLGRKKKGKGIQYVVLDPQWLADVFSTVVTVRHAYVKNGLLNRGFLFYFICFFFIFLVYYSPPFFFSFILNLFFSRSHRWSCSHLERLPRTPPPHPLPPSQQIWYHPPNGKLSCPCPLPPLCRCPLLFFSLLKIQHPFPSCCVALFPSRFHAQSPPWCLWPPSLLHFQDGGYSSGMEDWVLCAKSYSWSGRRWDYGQVVD